MSARPIRHRRALRLPWRALYLALWLAAPVAVACAGQPVPDGSAAPVVDGASGPELRERGATDLASAVSLLGADGAATPVTSAGVGTSMWGLQDYSSYLVVVDGVPWGGAFTPVVSRLNLADVERIEVQGGATPVLYATASFAGIIRVTRYAPADTPTVAHASIGSYDSGSAGYSGALPALGPVSQSLSVDVERDQLRGIDQGLTDVHGLYRAASDLAGGQLRVDVELETETRLPESPVPRIGTELAHTPLDASFQPEGARIGVHRVQAVVDYAHDSPLGGVEAVASYSEARIADLRGFLRSPLADDGVSANADGFDQSRSLRALYVDVHLRTPLAPSLALGWGVDWMGGDATQASHDFGYRVALGGAPGGGASEPEGTTGFSDRRSYLGAYGELDWTPAGRLSATVAARVSHNDEWRTASAGDGYGGLGALAATEHRWDVRVNGGATVGYHVGGDPATHTGGFDTRLTYRHTSQPPTPDYGPDYTPHLLQPMTGSRVEGGAKGTAFDRRLDWDLSASYTDIGNLVVAQTDAYGDPVLANAGAAHVRAVDLDTRWLPLGEQPLAISADVGAHRATFGTTHTLENDVPTNLVGHDFSLAARTVAAAGVAWEPAAGAYGGVNAGYTGRRYLDRLNSAPVGGYTTIDARAGYRAGGAGVVLRAANLTNRRDVVSDSELGDEAFYRSPARALTLEVYITWR